MRIIFTALFLLVLLKAPGQLHYVCYAARGPVTIDGRGDDPAWKMAPWTSYFTDIEGAVRPAPALRTRVKMLWDKTFLYVYAELQEPDLWGRLREHDTIIFLDNDFEVFINPDNSTHRYFEYELNCLNTEMDLFMSKPYKTGGNALMSWDARGLRTAVRLQGTLNRPGDVDSGWSVEMAIPLANMRFYGEKLPADSSVWRINFSRVEWDRDVVTGSYVPRTDPVSGNRLPEHNWVWSPQGVIDMHVPQLWGYLQFSTHAPADTVAFIPPADEEARKYLWELYYKETLYRYAHGEYASSLQVLGLESVRNGYALQLEGSPHGFWAMVSRDKIRVTINNEGLVQTR